MDIINICAKYVFYFCVGAITMALLFLVGAAIVFVLGGLIQNYPFGFFGALLLFGAYGARVAYQEYLDHRPL